MAAGYGRVLNHYDKLLGTLRNTKGAANSLRDKFITKEWIPYDAAANEEDLVKKALNQMQNNETDYEVFVDMLREIKGLQSVVNKITENDRVRLLTTEVCQPPQHSGQEAQLQEISGAFPQCPTPSDKTGKLSESNSKCTLPLLKRMDIPERIGAQYKDREEILTTKDALRVYEELQSAKNKYYGLGLEFRLDAEVMTGIRSKYSDSEDCLFEVIRQFLEKEGEATWRIMIDALNAIDLKNLAENLEMHHYPDPSSSSLRSATKNAASYKGHSPPEEALDEDGIEQFFTKYKKSVRESLENQLQHTVRDAADCLTSAMTYESTTQHTRLFLETHVPQLHGADTFDVLFGYMNGHCNYLNPDLLDRLVKKLKLQGVYNDYNHTLQQYRRNTLLIKFCLSHKSRKRKKTISNKLREDVKLAFKDLQGVTLEDVEEFRRESDEASFFSLEEFAKIVFTLLSTGEGDSSAVSKRPKI